MLPLQTGPCNRQRMSEQAGLSEVGLTGEGKLAGRRDVSVDHIS